MTSRHSPVQPGDRTPWWVLIGAAVLAVAYWGWDNAPDAPDVATTASETGGAGPRRAGVKDGSLATLFSEREYPRRSIARGEEGVVEFALTISARGRARCEVTRSSGHRQLDRATCRVLERARFVPALDDAGRPVADRIASRVRWVLPK